MAYDTNCEFSREKGGATNKGARPVPGCRSTVGCLHLATSTQPVGDARDGDVSDNLLVRGSGSDGIGR